MPKMGVAGGKGKLGRKPAARPSCCKTPETPHPCSNISLGYPPEINSENPAPVGHLLASKWGEGHLKIYENGQSDGKRKSKKL